jgi:uncharacterized membrane protein YhaH (DUF805 family)
MNFYFSKIKILAHAFIGAIIFAYFYLINNNQAWHLYIGGLSFISLFFMIYRLFRTKPILTIDENGITDYVASYGFIPWEDIITLSVTNIISFKFISINIKNFDTYLSRKPFFIRFILRIQPSLVNSPMLIDASYLSPGIKEAWEYICKIQKEKTIVAIKEVKENQIMAISQNTIVQKYLSFKGRTGRCEYLLRFFIAWIFIFLIGGVGTLAMLVMHIIQYEHGNLISHGTLNNVISLIVVLPFVSLILWSITCINSQRMHDIGLKWWFSMAFFSSYLGILVFLFLAFLGGNEGANQYGDQNNKPSVAKIIATIFAIIICMFLFLLWIGLVRVIAGK